MDQEHVEKFEDVEQTFFGLTKAKFIGAIVVGLIVMINLTTVLIWSRIDNLSRIQEQNRTALVALCASKTQTQAQVAASEQYLLDVKTGKRQPIAGISEADILTGIARQHTYLKALSVLACPVVR